MMTKMTHAQIAEQQRQLDNAIEIQCTDGNWDYSPYQHGLANGLIIANHIMSGAPTTEVEVLEAPKEWGYVKAHWEKVKNSKTNKVMNFVAAAILILGISGLGFLYLTGQMHTVDSRQIIETP